MTTPTLYHGDYLFDLSRESQEVIGAEFEKMLGHPLIGWGVIDRPADVARMQEHIMRVNDKEARIARQKRPLDSRWVKRKLVLWRGCWAIFVRVVRA